MPSSIRWPRRLVGSSRSRKRAFRTAGVLPRGWSAAAPRALAASSSRLPEASNRLPSGAASRRASSRRISPDTDSSRRRPLLTGRHFRLASPLPTDLAAPLAPPSTADLHWEGATLPDIAALGRFLPPGGDLVLEGGSAALDGALHYREGRLDGAFRLAGEGVALRFQEQALGGDLRLDLALGLLDPDARRLDLSGSRLRLDASSSEEAESLSLDLTLHEARLEIGRASCRERV